MAKKIVAQAKKALAKKTAVAAIVKPKEVKEICTSETEIARVDERTDRIVTKKTDEENVREVLIENLIEHVNTALGKIVTLEQRLDRIVARLSTAKPIKKDM